MVKIILIDKEEHIRLLYNEELKDAGYEVILMESPFGLLEKIKEENPDILIFGMRLGDYSWSLLMTEVRVRYPGLPIIFNTSREELWKQALKLGATKCFSKSFDLAPLLRYIDEIMAEGLR